MPAFNKVILIGRLTKEPEVKTTSNGKNIAKFSIAVDRKFKDADGTKKTDFFNCVAWGTTADYVGNYIGKGRLVNVEGRIEINNVEKDGVNRTFVNVNAESVEALEASQQNAGGNAGGKSAPAADADYFADEEDPFGDG